MQVTTLSASRRSVWRSRHLAACVLLVAASSAAAAQSDTVPRYRLRLLGVFDEETGNPIAGAKVSNVFGRSSTVTGPTGVVSLVFLSEGDNLVRLQRLGYETQTFLVQISPRDTTPLTMLMRHVIELQAMIITAMPSTLASRRMSGFFERERSNATGYFIDSTMIDRAGVYQFADLLRRRLPGIMTYNQQGQTYLLQSPRCFDGTAHGPPQVYLDGVPLTPDLLPTNGRDAPSIDGTPFNLADFQVSDLAGVEWYPDNTLLPMQFSSMSSRCGVLALWTKR
jgi:hypothetical protein